MGVEFNDNQKIQAYIKDNAKLTNIEIANHFGITEHQAWANRGAIKSALTRANTKANYVAQIKHCQKNCILTYPNDLKAHTFEFAKGIVDMNKKEEIRVRQEAESKKWREKQEKRNLAKKVVKEPKAIVEVVETYVAEVIENNDYYVPTELERMALALIKKEQIPLVDNYNNEQGENKKEERNVIAEYVANSGVVGLIPSLPFITWEIERKINDLVEGNHFIGVNRVVDTFNQSKSYVKDNGLKNCTPYNGSMADLIYDKDTDTFAHYILDYCCQLPTAMKQVEYIVHNDLVMVNGLLLMTFGLPIRSGKYADRVKEFSNYNNNNKKEDRGLSDKALENYFVNLVGKNYKILEFYYYHDTYPMVLVVIKRIK